MVGVENVGGVLVGNDIRLEARLSRERVSSVTGGRVFLLLRLVAPESRNSNRLPLNLAAVLDRSGSMGGAKLEYTKRALGFIVDQTAAADWLSVVTYDDQVDVLQPAGHVVNKDMLKARVQEIRIGGTTNLSGGLLSGAHEARKNVAQGNVNRVLLMTDGLANVGIVDPVELVEKVRQIRESGVNVTTLGVGADFNEDLLAAMAEAGGGDFYYIENPDQIPSIFAQELEGLLSVAAQSLNVHVNTGEGVGIKAVIGYKPTGSGTDIQMNLPDIYAGETKALVLELDVEPGKPGSKKLAAIELTYEDLLGKQGEVKITVELPITIAAGRDEPAAPENPDVMKEVYMARSAEALDEAIRRADTGDFDGSAQVLNEAVSHLCISAPSPEVVRQIDELRVRASQMESQQYDASVRKQMRTANAQTRSGRRQRPN
jgi:Ca-activated chloride channel family protein